MSQSPLNTKLGQVRDWSPDVAFRTSIAREGSSRGFSRGTLLNMLRATNHDVYEHSQHTARIAKALGQYLGLSPSDLVQLVQAAELHDLGKLYMDREILEKTGKLTTYEIQQIRRHPIYGAQLVYQSATLRPLAPIVLYHHERFDGTGYPVGLVGHEIPYLSRILSIADAISAMGSPSPRQPQPLTVEQIVAALKEQSGRQFEARLVDAASNLLIQGILPL